MTDDKKQLDFQPLKMHKNLVILCLQNHPEDLDKIFADGRFKTAAEAISALQAHPGEWIIGGVLSDNNCEY